MASINGSLAFMILQVLRETGHMKTAHMFERESGLYFDMAFLEVTVLSGNWNEVENYIHGFTSIGDNQESNRMFFEIRKTFYFEALYKKNLDLASNILLGGLEVFKPSNEELYNTLLQLLLSHEKREKIIPASFEDAVKADRENLVKLLKKLVKSNSLLKGKLVFPSIDRAVLDRFMKPGSHDNNASTSEETNNSLPRASSLDMIDPPCQSSSNVPACSAPPVLNYSSLKETFGSVEKVMAPFIDPRQADKPIDVPRNVSRTLNMGSRPTSMDFHPLNPAILLVGTAIGTIGLWDVCFADLLAFRNFSIFNLGACSTELQISLDRDPSELTDDIMNPDGTICELEYLNVSVTRVVWYPDGSSFGVAFSKNVVQLFTYSGGREIHKRIEVEAHRGRINDLAFCSPPYGDLSAISCGDDKTIKVWSTETGHTKFVFLVHDAPVYSICPRCRGKDHYILSVSTDGMLEASFYESRVRLNHKSKALGRTKLTCSDDGLRLFTCGTNTDGISVLVEWNEIFGVTTRAYKGLSLRQPSVVQFCQVKNLLAAGDDHRIKFWDIDYDHVLEIVDVHGELPATPQLCFSKEGTLLAVEANQSRIKILASIQGLSLLSSLRAIRKRSGRARRTNLGKAISDTSSSGGSNTVGAEDGHTSEDDEQKDAEGVRSETDTDESLLHFEIDL